MARALPRRGGSPRRRASLRDAATPGHGHVLVAVLALSDPLMFTDVVQIFGGRWKPESLYAYVVVFGAMAAVYLDWGLVRPEAQPS